jgi:hypothetical protein
VLCIGKSPPEINQYYTYNTIFWGISPIHWTQ